MGFRLFFATLSFLLISPALLAQQVGESADNPVKFFNLSLADLSSIAMSYGVSKEEISGKIVPTRAVDQFELYEQKNKLLDTAIAINIWKNFSDSRPLYVRFDNIYFEPLEYNFEKILCVLRKRKPRNYSAFASRNGKRAFSG